MKELKSKKTNKITIYTEEEYAVIVAKHPDWLKRYDVTDLRSIKSVVPKEIPAEIKITKKPKINEG